MIRRARRRAGDLEAPSRALSTRAVATYGSTGAGFLPHDSGRAARWPAARPRPASAARRRAPRTSRRRRGPPRRRRPRRTRPADGVRRARRPARARPHRPSAGRLRSTRARSARGEVGAALSAMSRPKVHPGAAHRGGGEPVTPEVGGLPHTAGVRLGGGRRDGPAHVRSRRPACRSCTPAGGARSPARAPGGWRPPRRRPRRHSGPVEVQHGGGVRDGPASSQDRPGPVCATRTRPSPPSAPARPIAPAAGSAPGADRLRGRGVHRLAHRRVEAAVHALAPQAPPCSRPPSPRRRRPSQPAARRPAPTRRAQAGPAAGPDRVLIRRPPEGGGVHVPGVRAPEDDQRDHAGDHAAHRGADEDRGSWATPASCRIRLYAAHRLSPSRRPPSAWAGPTAGRSRRAGRWWSGR